MSQEEVNTVKAIESDFDQVIDDIYLSKELHTRWAEDRAFVDPAAHIDYTIQDTAPAAGDLEAGEVRMGNGTGPNGRDEVFWSVDGQTVARVEADSIIT